MRCRCYILKLGVSGEREAARGRTKKSGEARGKGKKSKMKGRKDARTITIIHTLPAIFTFTRLALFSKSTLISDR